MPQPTDNEWTLNADSDVPLHTQFEQRIIDRIKGGEWKPGDRIPSERELMVRAGISRATVRQALNTLVHEQVLEKIHGRGTFVKPPRVEQPLNIVYSFAEQLSAIGMRLHDKVLALEVIPAPQTLALRLDVLPGTDVIHLMRLRFLEDTPFMVNIAHFPYDLCPGLLNETFDMSLYRMLTDKYELRIVRATDQIEARSADSKMAAYLDIPRRAPLMYVRRTAITTNNRVLHVGDNYIRGDMCRFRSDLDSQHTAQLEVKSSTDGADEAELT